MAAEEHAVRARIVTSGQHPLRHGANDIGYIHPGLPGVTSVGSALAYLTAVLFPQAKDEVATVGDLPAVGNVVNDYRIVLDDGDGKAAGYRWEQREGDVAAKWYKVSDWDWSADQIVAGMYQKTLYQYVHKWGFDDIDDEGNPLSGGDAGQHVYGGASAGSHLTLHANAGDGVGAQSGYVQMADNVRPTEDSAWSLGTTTARWMNVWTDELVAGTVEISSGSIEDSSGEIDFGLTDLTTGGGVTARDLILDDGDATIPALSFIADGELGFYRVTDGELGISSGGQRVASFGGGWLSLVVGEAAAPSLMIATATAAMYEPAAKQLGFATAGTARVLLLEDGDLVVNVDDFVVDASENRVGFGTAAPSVDLHLFRAAQATFGVESRHNTAAAGSRMAWYRARALNANLEPLDQVGVLDAYARVGGAWSVVARLEAVYRGDGTTSIGDLAFSVEDNSGLEEAMRIRYDGNVGIGTNDPADPLTVTGAATLGGIRVALAVLSPTTTDDDLVLSGNGTGVVMINDHLEPLADDAYDLGMGSSRWSDLYLVGGITDGIDYVSMTNLIAITDWGTPEDGWSLFWDEASGRWVAAGADAGTDHGSTSGLEDDDHPQYALLAGRGDGQVLRGGVNASGTLLLRSTDHATKGTISVDSLFQPNADGTIDLGASGAQWKDLYTSGQLIGARLQNVTTAGRPAAGAGSIGRLIYDTDEQDVYIDRGGTWKKMSQERYVNQDAVTWNGAVLTQTYDVSAEISDAREAIWAFKNNTNAFEQMYPEITTTETHVTVTFGIAPASGTYTLVGIG